VVVNARCNIVQRLVLLSNSDVAGGTKYVFQRPFSGGVVIHGEVRNSISYVSGDLRMQRGLSEYDITVHEDVLGVVLTTI